MYMIVKSDDVYLSRKGCLRSRPQELDGDREASHVHCKLRYGSLSQNFNDPLPNI